MGFGRWLSDKEFNYFAWNLCRKLRWVFELWADCVYGLGFRGGLTTFPAFLGFSMN